MKKTLTLLCLLFTIGLQAQVTADSVNTRVNKIDKFLDVLREFRIQMFVQPQFQYFDSLNADPAYVGGGNTSLTNNRFSIRRGRLKLSFEHDGKRGFKIIETAFQMEITEKGFSLKDFYGRVIDPWTGWLGLQAGVYNRPFGWEVAYPDNFLESPERARFEQIYLPGERDLGASLVIESPKTFKPVYLKLNAGVFNGVGNNVLEFDKQKDFIGELIARKTFGPEKCKFTIGGGASFYHGGVLQTTNNVFELKNDANGILKYTNVGDSTVKNKKAYLRQYYGVNLQLSADYKLGTTTIRGEFMGGQQPGTSSANTVPTAIGSDLYLRKFNSAVFYLTQTFKQKIKETTIKHEIVLKYDWIDPNAQIAGKDLASANDGKTSKADVKFQTIGIGYSIIPTDYFKLMLYYDVVINETTHIGGFTRNLRDNVLTLRTQFYFDTKWFVKK